MESVVLTKVWPVGDNRNFAAVAVSWVRKNNDAQSINCIECHDDFGSLYRHVPNRMFHTIGTSSGHLIIKLEDTHHNII